MITTIELVKTYITSHNRHFFFGWREREMGIFGRVPHNWGRWVLSRMISLSLERKSYSEKVSLGPELCCLRGGVMQKKFPMCPNSFFFLLLLHWCARTSPRETSTPANAFLSVGDCLSQCFPGSPGPHLTGAGAGSWATVGSAARTRGLVCLLPDARAGETCLGSHGIWCWVPEFSQWHFCLWMDAKLLLLGEGHDRVCLIQSCCWYKLSVHLESWSKQLLISNRTSAWGMEFKWIVWNSLMQWF